MTGPYATAAATYWKSGWRGVLPLPARKKKDPPAGFTGSSGVDPSFPDVQAWVDGRHGAGNIALRMPLDVIGIDVDDYDDKGGGLTFAAAERAHGKLPPTWRTTSRDDGVSGIRLYRVPPGMAWEQIGPGIETIQRAHRYAVVWPSVHPEGRTYRWIDPSGVVSTVIPDLDDLPSLPREWVDHYVKGQAADIQRNTMPSTAAATWLAGLARANSEPCRRISECVSADVASLERQSGSAHDLGCQATARLVRLAAEGHPGVLRVMGRLHKAFVDNVTSKIRRGTSRSPLDAEAEWRDLIVSAVNLVSADMPTAPSCDCDGALTALILPDPTRPVVNDIHPDPIPLTDGSSALKTQPDTNHDDTTSDDSDDDDRTSWWPRDLAGVLSGEEEEPPPTVLTRSDGQALWYAGKINGLIGESESGKTWVALLGVAQELDEGNRVLYLDFEDAAPGIVSRLRAIGVSGQAISTLLDYSDPAESLTAAASGDLRELLMERSYTLIVIDGFNAAMTLLGLDLMSNTDVTKFFQLLLRPLAKTGAAIAYVDHIGKNAADDSKGGIGAQAKRAMTTGCVIKVKVGEPFGRGMTGRLGLIVDKDRAGHVRGASAMGRDAGTAVLTSDRDTGSVVVDLLTPDMATPVQRTQGRQMQLMERISEWLATGPERTSLKAIRTAMGGRAADVDEALETLRKRGHIERQNVGSGFSHHLVQPFSIAGDLASDSGSETGSDQTVSHRVPTVSGTRLPRPSFDRVPVSHPYRWDTDTSTEAGSGTTPENDNRVPLDRDTVKPSIDVACKSCFRPVPEAITKALGGMCGKCAAEAGLV